jgi:hypothetical protein
MSNRRKRLGPQKRRSSTQDDEELMVFLAKEQEANSDSTGG